jgi:hypothetical protein
MQSKCNSPMDGLQTKNRRNIMHRLTRIVMPMALALLPMAINAADWPGFLGPKGNGFSAETGIKKNWNERAPKMLWSVPLTDGGYAGPSVAGGKVSTAPLYRAQDDVRLRSGKQQARWLSLPSG